MKHHICPKCHGGRMRLDQDRYTASERRYCPLCGHSEWLNFDRRTPSPLEVGGQFGITKRQPQSKIMREQGGA